MKERMDQHTDKLLQVLGQRAAEPKRRTSASQGLKLPSINMRKVDFEGVEGRRLNVKTKPQIKLQMKYEPKTQQAIKSQVVPDTCDQPIEDERVTKSLRCVKRGSPTAHLTNEKALKERQKSSPIRNRLKINREEVKSVEKEEMKVSKRNVRRPYTISYAQWCLFMALVNNFNNKAGTYTYRAYVGKGNNSILIKNTLKNRLWWNISDNENECNLYWLQNRDNKYIGTLKAKDQIPLYTPQFREQKKVRFLLEKKEDKAEEIDRSTRTGLWKLLLEQGRGRHPYQAQLPNNNNYLEERIRVHNHLQFNWNLTNKKALYYNLRAYYWELGRDPFEHIPLTFHIQKENDQEWQNFTKHYLTLQPKKKKKYLWIIKPGENSNQGSGIQVADSMEEIREIVGGKGREIEGKRDTQLKDRDTKDKDKDTKDKDNYVGGGKGAKETHLKCRSHIVQKYLMPLLYYKRKFDIRCYVLVTSIHGRIRVYWYEQGYIRTSSKQFSIKNIKSRQIHLTNDAVQKKCEDYGKYENGNKVSFSDFQRYLLQQYEQPFYSVVYPRMMALAADAFRATASLLDAKCRNYTFEIFGLDFMIDEEMKTWLIEVNNNPCLELGCPLLARVIPSMLQNAFKIALDPLFPPPLKHKMGDRDVFEGNRFTLLVDSEEEGLFIKKSVVRDLKNIVESDEDQDQHDD